MTLFAVAAWAYVIAHVGAGASVGFAALLLIEHLRQP